MDTEKENLEIKLDWKAPELILLSDAAKNTTSGKTFHATEMSSGAEIMGPS